jgi:8-oxo-dGTP pyrophosphatase MutT (NUDIX family)
MYSSQNKNSDIIEKLKVELKKPLPGFDAQRLMLPITRKEGHIEIPADAKKGAVLILLYEKSGQLMICFIKRTLDGGVHSGQISLPGGKMETSDKNLINTALREAEEEIGSPENENMVLGILSHLYIPVSNYEVLPVVAYCSLNPVFRINEKEVEELIEVSIDILTRNETCKMDKVMVRELEFEVPVYKIGEYKIWGATAMIMSEFIQIYNRINGN